MKKILFYCIASCIFVFNSCNNFDTAHINKKNSNDLPPSIGEDIFKGKAEKFVDENILQYNMYGTDGTCVVFIGENWNSDNNCYDNYRKEAKYNYSYNAKEKKLYMKLVGLYLNDILYTDFNEFVDNRYGMDNENIYSQEYLDMWKDTFKIQSEILFSYLCTYNDKTKILNKKGIIDINCIKNSVHFINQGFNGLWAWGAIMQGGCDGRFVSLNDNYAKVAFSYDNIITGYADIELKIHKISNTTGTVGITLLAMDNNLKEWLTNDYFKNVSEDEISSEIGKEFVYPSFGPDNTFILE